jgi:hypothetical protein
MHTVCETHAFRRAATQAGMSEDEISLLVNFLAENPMAGDEIGRDRRLSQGARGGARQGQERRL